jgi:hypothetical protein
MKIVAHVWQWKPATRWSIVLGLGVASAVVVASLPAIPQPLSYHSFADTRIFLGIPNALDILSNLPFIVVGVLGLYFGLRPQSTLTNTQRWAYSTMFAGLILTGLGSGYYHLLPDNQRLVWDRLPMTIAMAGFMSAMLVDRFGPKMLWLLPVMVAVGTGSVLEWNWSEQAGHGDLRWYALYQGLVIVVGVLLLLLFPSRTVGTQEFVIAAAGNVAAKLFELLDKPIYHVGGALSGHTLKHLSAGLGFVPLVLLIAFSLQSRSRKAGEDPL